MIDSPKPQPPTQEEWASRTTNFLFRACLALLPKTDSSQIIKLIAERRQLFAKVEGQPQFDKPTWDALLENLSSLSELLLKTTKTDISIHQNEVYFFDVLYFYKQEITSLNKLSGKYRHDRGQIAISLHQIHSNTLKKLLKPFIALVESKEDKLLSDDEQLNKQLVGECVSVLCGEYQNIITAQNNVDVHTYIAAGANLLAWIPYLKYAHPTAGYIVHDETHGTLSVKISKYVDNLKVHAYLALYKNYKIKKMTHQSLHFLKKALSHAFLSGSAILSEANEAIKMVGAQGEWNKLEFLELICQYLGRISYDKILPHQVEKMQQIKAIYFAKKGALELILNEQFAQHFCDATFKFFNYAIQENDLVIRFKANQPLNTEKLQQLVYLAKKQGLKLISENNKLVLKNYLRFDPKKINSVLSNLDTIILEFKNEPTTPSAVFSYQMSDVEPHYSQPSTVVVSSSSSSSTSTNSTSSPVPPKVKVKTTKATTDRVDEIDNSDDSDSIDDTATPMTKYELGFHADPSDKTPIYRLHGHGIPRGGYFVYWSLRNDKSMDNTQETKHHSMMMSGEIVKAGTGIRMMPCKDGMRFKSAIRNQDLRVIYMEVDNAVDKNGDSIVLFRAGDVMTHQQVKKFQRK